MPVYHLLIIFHRLYLPDATILPTVVRCVVQWRLLALSVDRTELAKFESLLILVSLYKTAVGLGNAGM